MGYAEVVVNYPTGPSVMSFHYCIPEAMSLQLGHLVRVPFGARPAQGVVVGLSDQSPVEETKEIAAVLDPRPALSPVQIALARWLSDYYCCTLLEAVRLMLPSGLEQRVRPTFAAISEAQAPDLPPLQRQILDYLRRWGRPARLEQLKATLSIPGMEAALRPLVRRGLVERGWELEEPRVRPRREKFVRLAVAQSELEAAGGFWAARAPKQAALLDYLREYGPERGAQPVPLAEVYAHTSADSTTVKALLRKGLVAVEEREVWRDPLAHRAYRPLDRPPQLTAAQAEAWEALREGLRQGKGGAYLLHGVTGSGKTELYLRAIQEVLAQGRQALVLVPEIALTAQTVHRFACRFPGRLGLWHSRLSAGEQYDEWRRIRAGLVDIVIGSRSALFLPLPRLGAIILDEEHEWTYKQEQVPRYHAREVAWKLAHLSGAALILGSATPDVVTYYRIQGGQGRYLALPERVEGAEGEPPAAWPRLIPLPPVEVVDMRRELKAGNRSIFSRRLHQAIAAALGTGEQVILFLNRRGTATFVMCRDCGAVPRCRRCDLSLAYHADQEGLICHQCNRRSPPPSHCPQCLSPRIRYFGLGTQKVAEEAQRAFPQARLLRWDRDVTRGKLAHEVLLERFVRHEADILIGTQMIAKGLDLPRVTLVGVISADTALHLPDLRCAERTFQVLTQVAGRAGRGPRGGRVIIQTYTPDHYAVQASSRHDYAAFYQRELAFRQQNAYPPFSELAKLVYQHTNDNRCRQEAEELGTLLRGKIDRQGLPDLEVLGPAPCFYRKVRGRYRWQLIIRGQAIHPLLRGLTLPRGWAPDMDPVSLL